MCTLNVRSTGLPSYCDCVFPLLSCTATSLITIMQTCIMSEVVESSWNVMAYGDAREGKWRGNWRREWVASTRHTTSEHVVSTITTADAYTSAASSRMNWSPRRFKWTRPFRWKTKSDFRACAVTFQTQSNYCRIFAVDMHAKMNLFCSLISYQKWMDHWH
jgi:hypothetical protein